MQQFIARHADQITGVLSGFDRVILRGSLMPLCHEDGIRRFLSRQGVLLKDFEPFAKATTALVRDGAFEATVGHGRPTIYLESSQTSKEGEARKLLAEHPIQSGLICLLRTLEPCWTWQVWRSRERKHPQQVRRKHTKGLSFYTYFDDPQFGFGHVRVQSYMPYHVQVYVNGREWLGRQLDHIGMRYIRADNCFPHLADVQRAQRVFDGMLDLPWREFLDNLVLRANPALASVIDAVGTGYYWTFHQTEWASDVMFRDADQLAACYPDMVRHAMTNFRSDDVMRFLGKKLNGNFLGEVISDFKRRREGVRTKHFVGGNSQKMYDKALPVPPIRGAMPAVLRFENTMNDPSAFRINRKAQGQPKSQRKPRPLRKSIDDIKPRTSISQEANNRHANALATVDSPVRVRDVLTPLTKPSDLDGRRVRPMRPWAAPDLPLLKAIASGDFLVNGFRNRDLHAAVYDRAVMSDTEQGKRSAHVGYVLRILRGHGLIEKVAGTHRYHVTDKGREVIATVLAIDEAALCKLKQCA